MLNKFIANVFGFFLALWHLIVLMTLSYILYCWYTEITFPPFERYFLLQDYPWLVIAGFFLHVLVSGLLSVIVSMHEQLGMIKESLLEDR